ncbi:DUF6114 domain-containing protein [Streptomyces luteolus]|uniref:DUF6114 domain-containing protein n=1 Tax=Streptomyces luteolus TaxID=3043615 RepID=A0ABT6SQ46_9ACTN|nr:DUF6114 domain-containing protein [Streptomyces sp. B-S-A12]MDI3417716.1 DUF6114 domain-containing protein [Streptomyces sp. B-S-A12]
MLLSRGGRVRNRLGGKVEALLPWPERRAALRRWRRRRPFWGGLLLIAAGAELLLAPLSPLGVLLSLGVGGIAAVVIGLALMLAGGFLWAAPHTRAYVSLNALLLSVAAFAVTNLGGFLVGSLLGVAGSALGFAWTPVRPSAESDEGGGGGGGQDGASHGRRALAVILPLTLLAGLGGGLASAPPAHAAKAKRDGAQAVRPGSVTPGSVTPGAVRPGDVRPGAVPTVITTSRFSPQGFLFAGVEELDTAEGPLKVIVLRMKAATLTDYVSTTRDPRRPQQTLSADDLELKGDVTLYMRKFHGCIEGSPLCVTFSPEGLPTPPVIPPFVFMTRVRAEQALVTTDSLNVDGLRIRSSDGPPRTVEVPDGPLPGAEQPAGEDRPDEAAPDRPEDDGSGDDGSGDGSPEDRPEPRPGDALGAVLTLRDPRREAVDVPWCEKVTLTVRNTGGRPVSGAVVVFDTKIVGALGRVRATETSRQDVPGVLDPGESRRHDWRVCVSERYAPGFLFGHRLEHRVSAVHSEGRSARVDVPRDRDGRTVTTDRLRGGD